MRFLLVPIFSFVLFAAYAQNGPNAYYNEIFIPNIRTVQFTLEGLQNSLPFYELGKPASLLLSFDDLDADAKFYTYTLIHCNMNWEASDLMFHEYARGFEHEEIRQYENSIGTRIPYTHYELTIPNQNTEITRSGNYILVILENGNWDKPVLMRRFVVLEQPVISIKMIKTRPGNVARMNTHQEIQFEIDTKDLIVRDPKNEISCTILQNGRWDNAIYDIESRFENGSLLVYNYMDKISFPAGKEFRSVDLRSTQFRGEGVYSLENVNGHTRVLVKLDKPRTFEPYFTKVDVNGQYVIANSDYASSQNSEMRADYLETVFTLETGQPYDEELFIFGALSDWKLRDEFKMYYNEEYRSYIGSAFLKQGFYDYIYAIANTDGTADESTLEGNWYESTNDYTLIVYFRPFGARYDQAIAATTLEWGQ